MEPFTKATGVVVPMDRVNVDTDSIVPARFLKRIERDGWGELLFFDWRFLPDGSPNPDFELNQPGYEGATILVAGRNFGSGSSREHAVWAIRQYGIRAIIAPSLAEIFHKNCFENGVVPVFLPEERVRDVAIGHEQLMDGHTHSIAPFLVGLWTNRLFRSSQFKFLSRCLHSTSSGGRPLPRPPEPAYDF